MNNTNQITPSQLKKLKLYFNKLKDSIKRKNKLKEFMKESVLKPKKLNPINLQEEIYNII